MRRDKKKKSNKKTMMRGEIKKDKVCLIKDEEIEMRVKKRKEE